MRVDIVTIFPGIFRPLDESIVGRARRDGLIEVNIVDLREFTGDERRTVDDKPYGGGPGMLMTPEPLFKAVEALRTDRAKVLLTSPQGRVFRQSVARGLSREAHLIILCGHYEGVDERVRQHLADMELSIGDFVLTSGNLAAMVVVDAVARLLPGALGSPMSEVEESFSNGMLEYPQYTRPADFRGMKVPEVLLSGNHAAIEDWRRGEAARRTRERRPDLLDGQ